VLPALEVAGLVVVGQSMPAGAALVCGRVYTAIGNWVSGRANTLLEAGLPADILVEKLQHLGSGVEEVDVPLVARGGVGRDEIVVAERRDGLPDSTLRHLVLGVESAVGRRLGRLVLEVAEDLDGAPVGVEAGGGRLNLLGSGGFCKGCDVAATNGKVGSVHLVELDLEPTRGDEPDVGTPGELGEVRTHVFALAAAHGVEEAVLEVDRDGRDLRGGECEQARDCVGVLEVVAPSGEAVE
jgi:hypothetical protein